MLMFAYKIPGVFKEYWKTQKGVFKKCSYMHELYFNTNFKEARKANISV